MSSRELTAKAQNVGRFAGLRLLGLGFWQAWWMIALCTNTLIQNDSHYEYIGSATLWVLAMTTLGYFVVVALSKRLSPLRSRAHNFALAGGLSAFGSLALPLSLSVLDGIFGTGVFFVSTLALSVGNAYLLIMWGELWSALATGRVGRHLYLSYSFAFVLFFIAYFLPSPFSVMFTSLLPLASVAILRSCNNEPRRPPSIIPLTSKQIPYKRILLCIFAVSVLFGFSQGVARTFAFGAPAEAEFLAQCFLLAGGAIAAIALSIVIRSPEAEPLALYKPVIPAMAAGFIALLLLPPSFAFVGGGLIIVGIYCLDMLIMLVSTDVAFRARIPVALSFGAGILASRTGTLCGMFAAQSFLWSDMFSPAARNEIMLIGVIALVLIGMVFYTQADLARLYQRPSQASQAGASASLLEKCGEIARACSLTSREAEVLVLLARGKTIKSICEELTIAQGTAKHHVSNIYRKVGVCDRQSLHAIVEQGAVGKSL